MDRRINTLTPHTIIITASSISIGERGRVLTKPIGASRCGILLEPRVAWSRNWHSVIELVDP